MGHHREVFGLVLDALDHHGELAELYRERIIDFVRANACYHCPGNIPAPEREDPHRGVPWRDIAVRSAALDILDLTARPEDREVVAALRPEPEQMAEDAKKAGDYRALAEHVDRLLAKLDAETAKPARSMTITWVSPFHPGVMNVEVFGSLFASFPTKIVSFSDSAMRFSRMFLKFAMRSQVQLYRVL